MRKKILSVLLMAMFVLLIASFVRGNTEGVVVTVPANNAVITGTAVLINISVNGTNYTESNADDTPLPSANLTNVSIFYTTDGGIEVHLAQNTTNVNNGTDSDWIFIIDTVNLPDAESPYTFTAKIYNGTGADLNERATDISVGVTVDNRIPTVTIDNVANSVLSGTASVTANVTDAEVCQIEFGTVSNFFNMTYNAGVCTYVLTVTNPPDASYLVTVIAYDGLNSTTSDAVNLVVDQITNKGGSGGASSLIINTGVKEFLDEQNRQQTMFIIVVLIGGAWFLSRKKK